MKNLIIITIIISLFLITSISYSKEITGAFGYELGDTYTEDSEFFTPEKLFRNFQRYQILTTPKTHRICVICATSKFSNTYKAEEEMEVVTRLFKLIYEKDSITHNTNEHFKKTVGFKQGNKVVCVKHESFTVKDTIQIIYADEALLELSFKEDVELELENTDILGL